MLSAEAKHRAEVNAGDLTSLDWDRIDELATAHTKVLSRIPSGNGKLITPGLRGYVDKRYWNKSINTATTTLPSDPPSLPRMPSTALPTADSSGQYTSVPHTGRDQFLRLPQHLEQHSQRNNENSLGGMFPDEFEAVSRAKREAYAPLPAPVGAERWEMKGGNPRLISVESRQEAFNMFDLDNTGLIRAFDVSIAMQAAGYNINHDLASVALQAFGIVAGANISLTEFHALCDYQESVLNYSDPVSAERQRATHIHQNRQKYARENLPNHKQLVGYQEGMLYEPPPSVVSSLDSDLDLISVPPNPGHLPPGAELSNQQSAFSMFDIDSSGTISVVDLPSALNAAGFIKIHFKPHVCDLLSTLDITNHQVTFIEYKRMCTLLEEQGAKKRK